MVLFPNTLDRSLRPSDRDRLYWSVAFDSSRLLSACLMQCANLAKAGYAIQIRETPDALTMSCDSLGSYVVSRRMCFGSIETRGANPLGAIVVLGLAGESPSDVVLALSNGVPLTRSEIDDALSNLIAQHARDVGEPFPDSAPHRESGAERSARSFTLAPTL